jgi:hypothetical protein
MREYFLERDKGVEDRPCVIHDCTRSLELGWPALLSAAVMTTMYGSDSARREGD